MSIYIRNITKSVSEKFNVLEVVENFTFQVIHLRYYFVINSSLLGW